MHYSYKKKIRRIIAHTKCTKTKTTLLLRFLLSSHTRFALYGGMCGKTIANLLQGGNFSFVSSSMNTEHAYTSTNNTIFTFFQTLFRSLSVQKSLTQFSSVSFWNSIHLMFNCSIDDSVWFQFFGFENYNNNLLLMAFGSAFKHTYMRPFGSFIVGLILFITIESIGLLVSICHSATMSWIEDEDKLSIILIKFCTFPPERKLMLLTSLFVYIYVECGFQLLLLWTILIKHLINEWKSMMHPFPFPEIGLSVAWTNDTFNGIRYKI